MLNQILMVVGVLCGLLGVAALIVPASKTSDTSVLVGGVLVSLGIILAATSLKIWLNWRRSMATNPADNSEPGCDPEWPDATDQPLPKLRSHPAPVERRRSQRIMVQVAVLLRAETPNFEHEPLLAFAASVNAHGGLLQSPRRIRAGQKITLLIPQTGKEARCHVLQSQKFSEDSFATAVEFDQQIPQFWPIASPPMDWSLVSVPHRSDYIAVKMN